MIAPSLRKRLTATVISIFLVSWLLSALLTTVAARLVLQSEVDKMLGSMLEVTAKVGRTFLQGELEQLQATFSQSMVVVNDQRGIEEGTRDNPVVVRLDEGLDLGTLGTPALNVWVGGIQLLIGQNTPIFPHPSQVDIGVALDQEMDGQMWRVTYLHDEGYQVWYATGLANTASQFDAGRLLLQLLMPLALIIPLTIVALYIGIHRNLKPLRALSQLIETRRARQSLEPIEEPAVPEEMIPVVDSLNHLLERLADTLENEKRFTANAAHELQTPLAAITTEVQLCQRLLTDDASAEMMQRIYARVQRASHSVRQLLTLARLDPQTPLGEETVLLHPVLEEVVSELGHRLSERGLQLQFEVDDGCSVMANREALLILFRNLVSNALRYTPRGGQVTITAGERQVTVENDSLEVREPERLTDRFYRGDNAPQLAEEAGTGLGLSIVSRICELHGARLALAYCADTGRFSARVQFR